MREQMKVIASNWGLRTHSRNEPEALTRSSGVPRGAVSPRMNFQPSIAQAFPDRGISNSKTPPFWLYSGTNYLHYSYLLALSPLPAAEPGCQPDPRQGCLEGTLRQIYLSLKEGRLPCFQRCLCSKLKQHTTICQGNAHCNNLHTCMHAHRLQMQVQFKERMFLERGRNGAHCCIRPHQCKQHSFWHGRV